MGGLGGIGAHPRVGRRQEPGVQQGAVIGVGQRGLLCCVGSGVAVAAQPFTQGVGRVHCGALPVGRTEPGKAEPRLIPEKHQIRLDRQTLFHHPLDIINNAVKGAVGQKQHAHPVKLARGLELQKLVLDLAQRNGAIHRVFVERVAVEINHLRPGQHHSVMVRFVAVAIDQHDVAGPDQRLHHDLVAGRGAVGGKIGLLGTERPAGQLLCFLDRAVGFEQAVEPA